MDQEVSDNVLEPVIPQAKKPWKPFVLVIILVLILVPLILGSYNLFASRQKNKPAKRASNTSLTSSVISLPQNGLFMQGVSTTPLDKVKLTDLPNTRDIDASAMYKDHLWFSGDGSIVEFDPKTNAIVAYSDPKRANCDSNFVILGDYLYAACRSLGTEAEIDQTYSTPSYQIYKIFLPERKVERIFKKKDGLENQQNFQLATPGDNEVWLATFDGVALFHPETERFVFYTKQLGIKGSHFGINQIIADKNYIWAVVSSNADSEGGLALFDRKTSTWTGFGPQVLKEHDQNRFDLEGTKNGSTIKLVPGGLQIAFRDGESPRILVEKQYDYVTKTWKTIGSVPYDGDNYEKENERLSQEYKSFAESFGSLDQSNPFTQAAVDGKEYVVNGRAYLSISPVVNNKRYLVSGGSIDVLDHAMKLPKILIPFSRNIDTERPHTEDPMIKMLTAPKSDIVIIFDPDAFAGFEGPDHYGTMHLWALDTKTDTIIAEGESTERYVWRIGETYTVQKNGDLLEVVGKAGETLFQFDTANKELVIVDSTVAPPQQPFSFHE